MAYQSSRVVSLALLAALYWTSSSGAQTSEFAIVGYLPDYRLASFDSTACKYLTDLIYFSTEPTSEGDIKRDHLSEAAIKKLQAIKAAHPIRLSLCIGGWERSAGFAKLASEKASRDRFVAALTAFCLENNFDGVNLDWEHPSDDAQRQDYGTLLTDIKKGFEPHDLQLTVAIADWQRLSPGAIQAVDRVLLMAYDAPARHSTFEYAKTAVERLQKNGVPAAKIVLGVPFYGRGIQLREKALSYAQIVEQSHPSSDTDEVDGIYFNNIDTIQRKARFALSHKLGGVMIWELGQDTAGERSLLRAIDAERAR